MRGDRADDFARAAGETGGSDLDGWTEVLPDPDDAANALGWREVRGAMIIVGIAAAAFAVAALMVLP